MGTIGLKTFLPDDENELIKGQDYLVIFKDRHTGKTGIAGAIWDGKQFKYCAGKFVNEEVKPVFKETDGKHHITALIKASTESIFQFQFPII